VNVAGTQVMTWTFMPLLLKSADPRLIFVAGLSQITVASEAYFPTPPQPAGWPKKVDFETIAYRCSKTALNMMMLDWNHKLKEDGVKVWGVGPGFLATDLGNIREKVKGMGGGHPSIGGKLIKSVVEGERDADVGKIVNKDGITPF
jgi:NAD(P)-dependent dehydrogenase (short-subunit alcohol dehydrogenase family)